MNRAFRLVWLVVALFFVATAVAFARNPLIYVRTDISSGVTQAQLDATIPAFQTMVSRDLSPIWGVDATLTTDPFLAAEADMQIDLLGYSDVEGALGYHEAFAGKAIAYVFVKESENDNEAWPLVFSHELQEMLVDPWIDRVAQDQATGRLWATEISDPVESGFYAYWINGIPMSDFIGPAWFNNGAPGPFDFMQFLHKPHQVGRHGYAQWFDTNFFRWRIVWGFRAKHDRGAVHCVTHIMC